MRLVAISRTKGDAATLNFVMGGMAIGLPSVFVGGIALGPLFLPANSLPQSNWGIQPRPRDNGNSQPPAPPSSITGRTEAAWTDTTNSLRNGVEAGVQAAEHAFNGTSAAPSGVAPGSAPAGGAVSSPWAAPAPTTGGSAPSWSSGTT